MNERKVQEGGLPWSMFGSNTSWDLNTELVNVSAQTREYHEPRRTKWKWKKWKPQETNTKPEVSVDLPQRGLSASACEWVHIIPSKISRQELGSSWKTATPESHLDRGLTGNDYLKNNCQMNKWVRVWVCIAERMDRRRKLVISGLDGRFIQPSHETTQNISRVIRQRSSW